MISRYRTARGAAALDMRQHQADLRTQLDLEIRYWDLIEAIEPSHLVMLLHELAKTDKLSEPQMRQVALYFDRAADGHLERVT